MLNWSYVNGNKGFLSEHDCIFVHRLLFTCLFGVNEQMTPSITKNKLCFYKKYWYTHLISLFMDSD